MADRAEKCAEVPECSSCGNRMRRGHQWECHDCGTFVEGRTHYPDDRELLEAAKEALKLYDSVPREVVEIMELFNAMERLRTAIERKA